MSSAILKINNVTRRFSNGTTALNNVTFSINEGEFTVICGRNGSGKSVLMSLIAQLDEPDSGTIEVPRNSVGLVFQDADAQILGETPEEDVAFGLKNNNVNLTVLRNKTEQTLKECGLYEKRCFPARQMSGGEKRRLAVAGILAMERNIIIFDEPFANLDYPGVLQVSSILKNLKQQGKTVIVLTHELEKILGLADRFIILDKSCIQYDGTPRDGLTLNLEEFGIRNPLAAYKSAEDLFWGAK
ncbi:MAG: energy-coupling factor ABC transporter ATP-binding protein [Spirochaetia bacterium]|nr:energy-coupling factor ABC transporter ATP-binding protein [Spirochaetia bacterium]